MLSYAVYGESEASPGRSHIYEGYGPSGTGVAVSQYGHVPQQQPYPYQPSQQPPLIRRPFDSPYSSEPVYANSQIAGPSGASNGIGLGMIPHRRAATTFVDNLEPSRGYNGRALSPMHATHEGSAGYYSGQEHAHPSPYLSAGGLGARLRHTSSESQLYAHAASFSPMPSQHAPSPHVPPPVPRPVTPDHSVRQRVSRTQSQQPQQSHLSTIKVLQWTPQRGEEDTQVTVILDADAVRAAQPSPYTGAPAVFGPEVLSAHDQKSYDPVNRRFAVTFGQAPASTQMTRAQVIDGNGVGQSMTSGPNEDDAFVVLTTFVPARHLMGPPGERVMVVVQTVDTDTDRILDSCIVGEWDPPMAYTPSQPITPRMHALKRAGDDLYSNRSAPGSHSPASAAYAGTPKRTPTVDWQRSPAVAQHDSITAQPCVTAPYPPTVSGQPAEVQPNGSDMAGRFPSETEQDGVQYPPQPLLVRTSQLSASAKSGAGGLYSHKVVLKLQGDLNLMAMGWSNEEWTARRRLVQFWPQQEANTLNLAFRPIAQSEYTPNSIVVSCIFRDEWNECFVTSVDAIYLLEALVGARFSVEEKNRIRRNLEGFKPITVSKSKADAEPFFKLIMGFPNPKPRNIEKDVKVFPWKVLGQALKKVLAKYSANYPIKPDDLGGASDKSPTAPAPTTPPPTNGLGTPAQKRHPSPQIVHTQASPQPANGSPIPLQHSPHPHAHPATAPGSPFLSPPGHGATGSSTHATGVRSAPQSPHAGQSFRHANLDVPPLHGITVSDFATGKSSTFDGATSTSDFANRAYSSTFARPSQQAHLFPAAEDYGVLASYVQPPSYDADPLFPQHDARSDNGLSATATFATPVSQAHLRSVSEGLGVYTPSILAMPADAISLDGYDPGASLPDEVVGAPLLLDEDGDPQLSGLVDTTSLDAVDDAINRMAALSQTHSRSHSRHSHEDGDEVTSLTPRLE